MEQALHVRRAGGADIPDIVALVNAGYRGDSSRLGWTTEADLLGGQRTDEEEISELMAMADSVFLLGFQQSRLVGVVHLRLDGDAVHLGMLTVRPGMQGAGIGKWLMAEAEGFARARWQARNMLMAVITLRHELIAYYHRRGYQTTGERQPFPASERFGIPKVAALEFEILRKVL
ncbi:MAG: GNAT family N-acetyltransferase [Ectothiorhodospiraceae bacterium]|nr:GNAT family N-acetyltransferase [Ectothiorhodospiraceae bacterium]MCH8502706.1 GNAT family N-acetyltransferase [Ectothiorhodospiraceae bacterium]